MSYALFVRRVNFTQLVREKLKNQIENPEVEKLGENTRDMNVIIAIARLELAEFRLLKVQYKYLRKSKLAIKPKKTDKRSKKWVKRGFQRFHVQNVERDSIQVSQEPKSNGERV